MTQYIALLRGIGPGNPNMHNDKLRGVLEDLGMRNVRSVISSGNILFESDSTDTAQLESTIEAAWPAKLGFTSTTIIRSYDDLQQLVARNPFGDREHSRATSLNVTFLKQRPTAQGELISGEHYRAIVAYDREICSIVDTTAAKTPQLMAHLEKQFGKAITTRTWKTILRIVDKMTAA